MTFTQADCTFYRASASCVAMCPAIPQAKLALSWERSRSAAAALYLLAFACVAFGADVVEPKRVLVVHSYARDSAPFGAVATMFRTELARRWAAPVVFYEVSLEDGQYGTPGNDDPVVEFLHSRYAARPPDLLVAIGPPASRFATQHRADLFPDAPRILNGEERLVRSLPVGPNDAIVAPRFSVRGQIEYLLQVLPRTEHIAIVLGNSRSEQFWAREFRQQFGAFADRVRFIWLNDRPLGAMRREVAALPEHSVIFYVMLTVDTAGVPSERDAALSSLRASTNAPIFGVFEDDLGHGIVGGLLVSQSQLGIAMGEVASRMLRGEVAGEKPRTTIIEAKTGTFDWRELKHWNIDEASLPAGSEVRFRQPSAWEQYWLPIMMGGTLMALQAALIGGLLVQRFRRRRAEREVLDMSGRLISAHEDERRRLAGELHDDFTQRLARLAIDMSRLEHAGDAASQDTARSVRKELVRVSEDVHDLSYRLHPSMLDDLGLVAALRAECNGIVRNEALSVEVDIEAIPDHLAPDTALCLFRVAQEALRNVVRHAMARRVTVSLKPMDGGLQLAITDDGRGFDPASSQRTPSLGLASMKERVRHLRGEFEVDSIPGQGTNVVAWVPLIADSP